MRGVSEIRTNIVTEIERVEASEKASEQERVREGVVKPRK